jgi:cell wall-associated NlpC family hydrolase
MTLNLSRWKHSRDPQPAPTVAQVQQCLNRKGSRLTVDGDFGRLTEDAVKRFQGRVGLEADGVVGPKTWAALTHSVQSTPPTGRRGQAIAALVYKIVTGGYHGGQHPAYVFGAENNLFHPEWITRTDCSELVQVCISYLLGRSWVDGSRTQFAATRHISVAQAIHIPGALLFISKNGQPSGIHHVAVSLGDGRTAEARSRHTSPQTGVFRVHGRFNLAGLVPGFTYTPRSAGVLAEAVDQADQVGITVDESEQADLLAAAELDTPVPLESDGIPLDHAGDSDAPADETEDNPEVQPFDVDEELSGV